MSQVICYTGVAKIGKVGHERNQARTGLEINTSLPKGNLSAVKDSMPLAIKSVLRALFYC